MRVIAAVLLCFTILSCSNLYISHNDMDLYCGSRIYKPFILPKEIEESHPRITKQLIRAMNRWAMSVPVDFHIISGMSGPVGSTSVVFGRYPTMSDPAGTNTLGFYNPELHLLFFNEEEEIDEKKFPDESIYKTCLHELGHVLGLPHIIGKVDNNGKLNFSGGRGFDIVLPTLKEARCCIMFPVEADKDQTDLSPIEILWARHALMHDLNLTSFLGTCFYEENDD